MLTLRIASKIGIGTLSLLRMGKKSKLLVTKVFGEHEFTQESSYRDGGHQDRPIVVENHRSYDKSSRRDR